MRGWGRCGGARIEGGDDQAGIIAPGLVQLVLGGVGRTGGRNRFGQQRRGFRLLGGDGTALSLWSGDPNSWRIRFRLLAAGYLRYQRRDVGAADERRRGGANARVVYIAAVTQHLNRRGDDPSRALS